jgi:hypothetical protein
MSKLITVASAEKTFTVAGVSDLNGVYKLRVANSTDRVKVLMRNGHEDVRLIQLPSAMTKLEAVNYLMSLEHDEQLLIDDKDTALLFSDIEAQQAFADFLGKAAPKVVTKQEVVDNIDFEAAADALEAELATA